MSDDSKLTWRIYKIVNDPERGISDLVRWSRTLEAKNYDPVMEQDGYAIGDPGTENGHTLGTEDTARNLTGGAGNVDVFLRVQIYQSENRADQNLTKTLKLKANLSGAGYLDVPGPGSGDATHPIEMVDHVSITHGGDTTERLTAPAAGSFLGDNQGQCDTSGTQGASFTWTNDVNEYIELLFSLRCLDAYLGGGDTITFQVTESDDTALASYNVTPTINWQEAIAASAGDGVDFSDTAAADATEVASAADGLEIGEDFTTVTYELWDGDGFELSDTPVGETALQTGEATDGVDFSDTPTVTSQESVSVADGAEFGDTPTADATELASASDGLELSDTPVGDATVPATVTDGFELSDAPTVDATERGSLADGAEFGDTATVISAEGVSVADGAEFSDAPVGAATQPASDSDGVEFSDTPTGDVSQQVSAADGLEFSDSPTVTSVEGASAADGAEFGDTPTTTSVEGISVADGAEFGDSPAATATELASDSDGIEFSDAPTAEISQQVSATDGAEFGDSPTVRTDEAISVADGAEFSDTPVGEGGNSVSVDDGFDLSDTPAATAAEIASGSDGAEFSDTPVGISTTPATVSDGVEFGDTAVGEIPAETASVADGIEFSEDFTTTTYELWEGDGFELGDTVAAQLQMGVSISDGFEIGEGIDLVETTSFDDEVIEFSDTPTTPSLYSGEVTDGVVLADLVAWAVTAAATDGFTFTDSVRWGGLAPTLEIPLTVHWAMEARRIAWTLENRAADWQTDDREAEIK